MVKVKFLVISPIFICHGMVVDFDHAIPDDEEIPRGATFIVVVEEIFSSEKEKVYLEFSTGQIIRMPRRFVREWTQIGAIEEVELPEQEIKKMKYEPAKSLWDLD